MNEINDRTFTDLQKIGNLSDFVRYIFEQTKRIHC